MENPEQRSPEQKELAHWEALADQLEKIQETLSPGRPTNISTIITFLRRNEIQNAKAKYLNDGDKFYQYPEAKELLDKELGTFEQLMDELYPPK
jgi:hypothetical protein